MVKVSYSKKQNKWITLPPHSKDGMYMDGFLFNTFNNARTIMNKKDVDLVTAVCGYPGSGKSTLGIQIATFCDPTFHVDRICLDIPQFIQAVKDAKPRQAVVLDESYEGLNSAEVRRDVGRALLNMLNVIRQKNLYIFLILPNFFDLAKNIAVFRCRYMIMCYGTDFGDVGKFVAFDRYTKHLLYMKGKRFEDYNSVKGDFYGTFTSYLPPQFDNETYLIKKQKAMESIKVGENTSKPLISRNNLIIYVTNELNIPSKKVAEVTEISVSQVNRIKAQQS